MSQAGERVGDFELEAKLGEGGMAAVYRARYVPLDTAHALKILHPRFRSDPAVRQRFLDEAKVQAHLRHPNIVKVTSIVATPEHAALVMDLVDGASLESMVGKVQGDPGTIRELMLQVLAAVGHAHSHGVIHRDLKPANVLLHHEDGRVIPKVTDFGIAKVSAALAGSGKKSTQGDARMGTLGYMSPEQIRRAKDVTERSDIFSLGAMLYELATGEAAFDGDSDYDVMENICHGRFVAPERRYDRIDPALAAVIGKALAVDPAERFASCDAMAVALRAGGSAVVARPVRPQGAGPPALVTVAEEPSAIVVSDVEARRRRIEARAQPRPLAAAESRGGPPARSISAADAGDRRQSFAQPARPAPALRSPPVRSRWFVWLSVAVAMTGLIAWGAYLRSRENEGQSGRGNDADRALAKMAELADEMCSCPDVQCAKSVVDELWSIDEARPSLTSDQLARWATLDDRMSACRERLTRELAPPTSTPAKPRRPAR